MSFLFLGSFLECMSPFFASSFSSISFACTTVGASILRCNLGPSINSKRNKAEPVLLPYETNEWVRKKEAPTLMLQREWRQKERKLLFQVWMESSLTGLFEASSEADCCSSCLGSCSYLKLWQTPWVTMPFLDSIHPPRLDWKASHQMCSYLSCLSLLLLLLLYE